MARPVEPAAREPGSPGLEERPPRVERLPGAVASLLLQAAQDRSRQGHRGVAAPARPRLEAGARALQAPHHHLGRLARPTPGEGQARAARAQSDGRRTRPPARMLYCWDWWQSHCGRCAAAVVPD